VHRELSEVAAVHPRRVVGTAGRFSQGAAWFGTHPVNGCSLLSARRRSGRRREQCRVDQQPGLQTTLHGCVRLRGAQAQLLRQTCIRPALLTPSHELEGDQEILGFELHFVLYSQILNTEYKT
jgi:hypothetical protein